MRASDIKKLYINGDFRICCSRNLYGAWNGFIFKIYKLISKKMVKDALGNEIIIGQKYGYTINQNGHIQVIVGTAKSFNKLKATLENIEESTGIYGEPGPFKKQDRARSAYGCNMFPVK